MPTIAETLIPAARLVPFTPGVDVGVIGGINRFYPGGANERVTLANVMDYGAAGNADVTTGSIAEGETELTVADASSWAVGNYIRVGLPEIQSLEITSDATESGTIMVNAPRIDAKPENIQVTIVNGETAAQIAAKIRAKPFKTFTTGGSGAVVTFTQKDYYPVSLTVRLNEPSGAGFTIDSITYTGTRTQVGVLAVHRSAADAAWYAKVEAIDGNVLTLNQPATATVTNAYVQHDDYAAFQLALQSGVGNGLYAPAGTYPTYRTIGGIWCNGRTIRGAGPLATFIDQRSDGGVELGSRAGGSPAVTPTTVVSGLARGSTEVTLAGEMGDLTVGSLMVIFVENDESLPVVSVYGFNVFYGEDAAPTKQMVRITAVDDHTVTFTPPLFSDYGGGALATQIQRMVFPSTAAGLEDLSVNSDSYHPGAGINVSMVGCYNSWIRNCVIQHAINYPLSVASNLNCEIRHSFIEGSQNAGSNGAGILFDGHSCLIEDNVLKDAFPIIEMNGGSAGNAWLYNHDATTGGGGEWNTNHAPHNQYNLFEGNTMGWQKSDGYFGSDAYLTLFRNFMGPSLPGVNLKRFNRYTSIVGNLMPNLAGPEYAGFPFISNGAYDGEIDYAAGERWRDWKRTWEVTARAGEFSTGEITLADVSGRLWLGDQVIRLEWSPTSTTSVRVTAINEDGTVGQILWLGGAAIQSPGTEAIVWPGAHYAGTPTADAGSFNEIDRNVGATMISKGNRDIGVGYEDNLGADSLPDSLAYTDMPDWWTLPAWPPFDPQDESTAEVARIPAGYRYLNGEYEPAVATPVHSPPGGPYSEPQSVTISCTTPDTVLHYTLDGSTPDNTDAVYSSPIAIGLGSTTLRSIAHNGEEYSAVTTSNYSIAEEEPDPPSGAVRVNLLGAQFRIAGKLLTVGGE